MSENPAQRVLKPAIVVDGVVESAPVIQSEIPAGTSPSPWGAARRTSSA